MTRQTTLIGQFAAIPLAVLSGVILAYALPPRDFGLLGWVALSPMLLASRLLRPVYAVGLGVITAFTCGIVLAEGHWKELHEIGNLIGAFGGLAAVLAFTACAASFGANRTSASVWFLFVACAGVTAELLSWLVFPVTIAISQHQNAAALRVSSVVGVWGVSFLLWFAQSALAVVVWRPKPALAGTLVVLVVLGVAYFVPSAPKESRAVSVAAVQADSGCASGLTDSIPAGSLVVWPELLAQAGDTTPELCARKGRFYLAASFLEPAKPRAHNACRLISPSGECQGIVRKQHLFGRETLEFSPGEHSSPMSCDGVKVGVAICYDTEFTDVVRNLAREGAQVVLVPNHDPEIPNYLFSYLHAAIIPFRAAENGIPIVWAEKNALSMIVGRDGLIVAQAEPGRRTVVRGQVSIRRGTTIYTRIGDAFAYLCAVGFVVLLICTRGSAGPSGYRRCSWRP